MFSGTASTFEPKRETGKNMAQEERSSMHANKKALESEACSSHNKCVLVDKLAGSIHASVNLEDDRNERRSDL